MTEILQEGSEIDVNTDDGFSAALAQAAGVEVPAPAGETSAAPVAESTPSESHGPGRQAPAAPVEAAQPEGAAPVADEGEALDPTIADYLSRFDGDPQAALAAALKESTEAQSLIGRQGSELGELRQLKEQLARLEGQVSAAPKPHVPVPSATSPDVEAIEAMVVDHGGHAAMSWVVSNRPDLIDPALKAWEEVDVVGAARFAARMEAAEMLGQREEAAPQVDPQREFVDRLHRQDQMNAAINTVKQGFQPADWEAIKDHLTPALEAEDTPEIVKKAVVSLDPTEQVQGIKILTQFARARALAASSEIATTERAGQVRTMKQAATVVSGSLRPAQERKPEESAREAAIKSFQERVLAAGTPSVHEGLTFE